MMLADSYLNIYIHRKVAFLDQLPKEAGYIFGTAYVNVPPARCYNVPVNSKTAHAAPPPPGKPPGI